MLDACHHISLEVVGKGPFPEPSPIVHTGNFQLICVAIFPSGTAELHTDLAGDFPIEGYRVGRSRRLTFLGPRGKLIMGPICQGSLPFVLLLLVSSSLVLKLLRLLASCPVPTYPDDFLQWHKQLDPAAVLRLHLQIIFHPAFNFSRSHGISWASHNSQSTQQSSSPVPPFSLSPSIGLAGYTLRGSSTFHSPTPYPQVSCRLRIQPLLSERWRAQFAGGETFTSPTAINTYCISLYIFTVNTYILQTIKK